MLVHLCMQSTAHSFLKPHFTFPAHNFSKACCLLHQDRAQSVEANGLFDPLIQLNWPTHIWRHGWHMQLNL